MDKKRRKTVLINRGFQFKMILKFIVLNVIIMALFGGLLLLFLNSEVESNLQSAHVTYRSIKDMLFPLILTLTVINVLVSSLIIWGFVLYASFRIAGPLYRFNEALIAISNRNLKPIADIRKGDQLFECSETVMDMSNIIAGDFKRMKSKIDEIMELNEKGSSKDEIVEKLKEFEVFMDQYDY